MAHDGQHDDDGPPSPGTVIGAAVDVIANTPGAQIFIYVAAPGAEPVIFASGDDDDAEALLTGLHGWLAPQFEDDEEEG